MSALRYQPKKSHHDLWLKIIFNDLATDNSIRSFINFVESTRTGNLVT